MAGCRWAPFLGFQALQVGCPVSLIATTALLRWRAVEAEGGERLPWRPLFALVAVATILILFYGLFHPVRMGGGGGEIGYGPGQREHAMVEIRNGGFNDVTLLGLSIPAFASGPMNPLNPAPFKGTVLAGRSSLWLTLKQPGCPPKIVTLRYRLFGWKMSEPLVLRQNCPNS